MTSRKNESGTANGESTRSLPNIIGACLNSRLLPEPRTQARQEIDLQESEMMSVNRIAKTHFVHGKRRYLRYSGGWLRTVGWTERIPVNGGL